MDQWKDFNSIEFNIVNWETKPLHDASSPAFSPFNKPGVFAFQKLSTGNSQAPCQEEIYSFYQMGQPSAFIWCKFQCEDCPILHRVTGNHTKNFTENDTTASIRFLCGIWWNKLLTLLMLLQWKISFHVKMGKITERTCMTWIGQDLNSQCWIWSRSLKKSDVLIARKDSLFNFVCWFILTATPSSNT